MIKLKQKCRRDNASKGDHIDPATFSRVTYYSTHGLLHAVDFFFKNVKSICCHFWWVARIFAKIEIFHATHARFDFNWTFLWSKFLSEIAPTSPLKRSKAQPSSFKKVLKSRVWKHARFSNYVIGHRNLTFDKKNRWRDWMDAYYR